MSPIDRLSAVSRVDFSQPKYVGRLKSTLLAIGGDKEGYYNQLCFYKYAFEKITGKKVSKAGIIYVENHQKSVYKELCEEDMQYIEDKIKDAYKNIKQMEFNPIKESRDGECKFCAYKHLCRLDLI